MKLQQLHEVAIADSSWDWDEFYGHNLYRDHYSKGDKVFKGAGLDLRNRSLTSLKGLPFDEIVGYLLLDDNSLGAGSGFQYAPKKIGRGVSFKYNKFTNLKDIHLHLPEVNGWLDLAYNPIESHVLGLLKIKGLTGLRLSSIPDNDLATKKWGWAVTMSRYIAAINTGKITVKEALYGCQEALIKTNYDEYAKL